MKPDERRPPRGGVDSNLSPCARSAGHRCAPRAGAWIETSKTRRMRLPLLVAHHAAWLLLQIECPTNPLQGTGPMGGAHEAAQVKGIPIALQ